MQPRAQIVVAFIIVAASMYKFTPRISIRSASVFSGLFAATKMEPKQYSVQRYVPANPNGPFPHSASDMIPMDAGNDGVFYAPSRFVTHIDDNAIINLKQYYDKELPEKGSILDFCSSWVSHYPPRIAKAVESGEVKVLGTGMNEAELNRNAVFSPGNDAQLSQRENNEGRRWWVQDLNENPDFTVPKLGGEDVKFDASTCVVSIDYLTKPVEVLKSLRQRTIEGGRVHLAISNRCFPTKVVRRWLNISEQKRLEMVGDYLHWAGWKDIEIVDVVQGGFMTDPLWVVRASNLQ